MLKSSNKTDVNTTELVITIDGATFENAVEQEFQRQRKNIQVKGFRRARLPESSSRRSTARAHSTRALSTTSSDPR